MSVPRAAGVREPGVLTPAEWGVFLAVTAANLIPIWAFRYFPGQDTADHLYAVGVLRALADGTAAPSVAAAFAPALGLKTNMLFHALMLGLVRLGLSIDLAHRLVLSGYALALPLAGIFCLRAAAPASGPLALLLLPLVWSWFAVQGLYNYVLSLPPALVWLGIVARDGGRPRVPAALALGVSAALVFLAHAVTFAFLLLVTTWRILFPGDGSRLSPARRLAAAWPAALALLPSAVVWSASFVVTTFTAHAPLEPSVSRWEMYDFPSALGAFFVEFAVRYHLIDLALLGPPLVALIALPLAARRAGGSAAPRWPLHVAGALTVLYFALPHIMLGSDVSPRLRPLVVFTLLCYGGVSLSPRARRRVMLLALVSGLGGAAFLSANFRSLGRQLDDFTSGIPYVRPGSKVYPVVFDPRSPSILVKPFLHAWGYYGLARDVVTPYAFAWDETRFPYRYRTLPVHTLGSSFPSDAEDEPYALVQGRLCSSVRRFSPSLSCDEVRTRTMGRIASLGASYDYLLTWAAPPDFPALLAARGYRLVHARGLLALYEPPGVGARVTAGRLERRPPS